MVSVQLSCSKCVRVFYTDMKSEECSVIKEGDYITFECPHCNKNQRVKVEIIGYKK